MAEELLLVNPKSRRRRRRRTKSKAPVRRRRRTSRRTPARRRTYRRNPSPRMGKMTATFMPAVQGALGATLLDVAFGYLPLPAALTVGPMRHVVKVASAAGLGIVLGNIVKGATAKNMATGAMTVAFHSAIKEMAGNIPGLQLGAYDPQMLAYYSPGQIANESMGAYVDTGMGEYIDEMNGVY